MNKHQIKVIVNGTPYEVELGDLSSSSTTVKVNGQPYEVVIENDEDGSGGSRPASYQREEIKRERPVIAQPASAVTKQEKPASFSSSNEVKAPMPGTILDIAVKAGDKVARGDQLCALEAMKMKSAIRAPKDGLIAGVDVSEGQKVVFGDVLVRLA